MSSERSVRSFYRRLPWNVSVRLDGYYSDGDDLDPAVEDPDRPPRRVVVELPDFLADSLAHMIDRVWDVAEHLTDGCPIDGPARDLAEALRAAVHTEPGYRCRSVDRGPAADAWATPKALRAALRPTAMVRFEREFRRALAEAAETFDLTAVDACMHRWRLVARSSTHRATG
jgi:hypothetical protein